MKRIDTARWKPSPENPNKLVYDGQRTAQEIYEELRYRLEASGYLPDEYLLLNMNWQDGKVFPEDADIFCTVDYGGSEGIYLDMYIKHYDKEGKPHTENFITGKTLGESDNDLDRMFLVASACTKAFHSDGVHARYVQVGEAEQPKSTVIHLNEDEKKAVTDSLMDTRLRLKSENKPLEVIEQLLRRIIGNITDYLKTVGERPKTLDEHDRAVLAIHDGNMEEFNDAYPKAPHMYGNLLTQAAARPDMIGRIMTEKLLSTATNVSSAMYLQAGKNAIDIGDEVRAVMLMQKAAVCVLDLDKRFYSDLLFHALGHDERHGKHENLAYELAKLCTPEQIQQADPYLLKIAMMSKDYRFANLLVEKGIDIKTEPAMLFYAAALQKNVQMAELLLERGADIDGQQHAALRACMNINDPASAMFLIKCGADFEGFFENVTNKAARGAKLPDNEIGFLHSVKSYWENNIRDNGAPLPEQDDESELEQN